MPTQLIRKQFLLTEAENKKLEAEADQQGLSVSNLTRVRHGLEPLEMGGKRANTGRPPTARKKAGKKVINK
ncbi:MAG: hypothetical protein M3362_20820 [Acidobacteriota bacterium]|nr:hypothetical protein [Acidobacteriota bacterium]